MFARESYKGFEVASEELDPLALTKASYKELPVVWPPSA
jgi:hypothetical protein